MLIRDMVRAKPVSWLLFIIGSDIMMTYGLLLYHDVSHFSPARDYLSIVKFVSFDLISFVFIMLFFDWVHVKFLSEGPENVIDKILRIGGTQWRPISVGLRLVLLFYR
ncbi:hypothetical protein GCM10025884_07580 [Leuconostoc gelidum subsp. gelidum]|nr:hypothetical protein GCM10025884_07580 [Leuconostoc gelidum subsp. gelidum]